MIRISAIQVNGSWNSVPNSQNGVSGAESLAFFGGDKAKGSPLKGCVDYPNLICVFPANSQLRREKQARNSVQCQTGTLRDACGMWLFPLDPEGKGDES